MRDSITQQRWLPVIPVLAMVMALSKVMAQAPVQAGPEPLAITGDFGSDGWVDANQPIGLRFSRPLDLRTERLAVIVGHTDLSALFAVTPTVARYAANTLSL